MRLVCLSAVKNSLTAFLRQDSGQTLVEFVLLIAVTISVLVFLKDSVKKLTTSMWSLMGRRVAAPCHDLNACNPGADFTL